MFVYQLNFSEDAIFPLRLRVIEKKEHEISCQTHLLRYVNLGHFLNLSKLPFLLI